MTSYDQRNASGGRASPRPNGGGSRIPSKSILGHKRTGSGRIEPKENVPEEGSAFSSPDLSGGSGGKFQPTYSPIARPLSRVHRNNTAGAAAQETESPRDTKIPQPKTTVPNPERTNGQHTPGSPMPSPNNPVRRIRQPLGLKAAFKLAEAQEARERSGSSSSSGSIDLKQAFRMANAEANRVAVGSPSPAPRSYRRRESMDTRSNQYFGSPDNADLGQRLQQFDRHHSLSNNSGPLDGLFTTRGRVGPKVAETATTLARKASNGSLENSPERRRNSLASPEASKKTDAEKLNWNAVQRNSLLPSFQFAPLPPMEIDNENENENLDSSPIIGPTYPSPEKSYNWHLDADFTAGDLQVSDSPRIRLGRHDDDVGASPVVNVPQIRRSNDKLDRIRELEIEAANADIPDDESSSLLRRTNHKLDEIRAREMVASSPRVLAKSRLDEIRAKNAEARSRSTSPEEARTSSKESPREEELNPSNDPSHRQNRTSPPPSAPVFGMSITDGLQDSNREGAMGQRTKESVAPERSQPPVLDDSYDLLRRLARATSSSPSPQNSPQLPERQIPMTSTTDKTSEEKENNRPPLAREERQPRDMRAKNSRDRLTVGFTGLHKVPSSDSVGNKRQSLVNSESDPTDRIEAEMKLFAPTDNYSEKGSVRGPSPGLSEKSESIDEETPKPKKRMDPLSLPTPRVTGAYVETPATVKVERGDEWVDVESDTPAPQRASLGKKAEESGEPKVKDEGVKNSGKEAKSSGKTMRASGHRTKTQSKRHKPPVNTANIPTAKEDLRAIIQQHGIDESTLEDFDGLLDDKDIDSGELKKLVDVAVLKIEEDMKTPGLTDRERELQAYDRMSKSLKTGLQGIRSAKQGIERLEDKVAHSEHKRLPTQFDVDLGNSALFPVGPPLHDQHVYMAWPMLYHRQPRFKLTPLGIIALILATWYAIESAFCFLYVDTYQCPRGMTCDWSPNEPYFPYAAPFMLDEWTTGGKGRALAWRVGDEVGDIAAEVADWVTGHDFTKDEVMYMNVWQRKRQKRRLHRRGLHWKWIEPAQFKHKFQAWRDSWNERQRAMEEGEPIWGDESMSADERL
ncbi:hypothetical protein SUNI508_05634 [Seiridium unicorne]|uniref:Uncharacterized protein n=1 Tax=Seiridium unicorne TaxID=138068 RepID=A0ABR2V4H7_9PEZI